MRLVWHRAAANQFDHELALLGVSVGVLAGGAIWLTFGLPWPRCLFRSVTGLPCFSCGVTRCTISLVHGNFLTAWQWNPLGFVAVCALILFDLYAAIVIIGRMRRLRVVDWTAREKRFTRILVASALALNWIYLLAHHDRF
jgi:hypothetical protein